jgi:hypothetical protein
MANEEDGCSGCGCLITAIIVIIVLATLCGRVKSLEEQDKWKHISENTK